LIFLLGENAQQTVQQPQSTLYGERKQCKQTSHLKWILPTEATSNGT